MKLNEYFKQFIGNISLNPQREARINSAYETWQGLFKNDDEIKDIYKDFYLQGSYAINAAIRPQNGNEFDVDTVLLLKFSDDMGAKEAINFLAERTKSKETYKDKILVKDRCVRVNYAGDFHLDVVPAKPTDEEYVLIPSKKDNEWIKTNPAGFVKWCKQKKGGFAKVTKMIKYWRDVAVGEKTAPKSILLTTIIGHHYISADSEAESLVLTLAEMVDNLDNYLEDDEPYVENPTLREENLARDWDKESYDIFKKKLQKFAKDARAALDEQDKDESIKKWISIFGSAFPKELPKAAEVASQVAAGKAFVNSQGHVNTESGQKIQGHRFYGVTGHGK